MACEEREMDLLLYVHGELPPGRRLLTTLHLRRCARCRARREHWQRATNRVAASVRGPMLPPWSPRPAHPIFPGALFTLLLATLVTAVLLVAVGLAVRQTHPRPAPAASGPCRPDLPNDQCR